MTCIDALRLHLAPAAVAVDEAHLQLLRSFLVEAPAALHLGRAAAPGRSTVRAQRHAVVAHYAWHVCTLARLQACQARLSLHALQAAEQEMCACS